jgi:hypothetical protein
MEEEEEAPQKTKYRGKSQEQKEHDAQHEYSCINVKLKSILKLPSLEPVLQSCVLNLNKIALEAHYLANDHYLRCFQLSLPLPEKLNQSFFYSCCALVSGSSLVRNKDLIETFNEYKQSRPLDFKIPRNEYMGKLMNNIAKQMETNALNHVVLNFRSRLVRYVGLKYGVSNKKLRESFILDAFFKKEDRTSDHDDFLSWIGKEYYPKTNKFVLDNVNYFLKKEYEILQLWKVLIQRQKDGDCFLCCL